MGRDEKEVDADACLQVGPGQLMLLFEAPEQMRRERVIARGRVEGRPEDTATGFGFRNERFEDLKAETVNMFEERGLLKKVRCSWGE